MFEKLLTAILALTVAIEANTAAQKGGKAKATKGESAPEEKTPPPTAETTPEKKEEKAPPAPEGPTIQSVLAVAQQILDKGGLQRVKDTNAKLGVKKVSECPPEKLPELDKELKKVLAEIDAV